MPKLYARLHRRFAPDRGMTRREMLRTSLGAAAGLLLSERMGVLAQAGKRIVVVGAGFSGLTAAFELKRQGHQVTVLEAQNRVGGRIYTLRAPFAPGLYAEAGGMRIPRAHDLTLRYCELFGLEMRPFVMGNPNALVYLGGQRMTKAEADRHPDRLASLTVLSRPHPKSFRRALLKEDGDQKRRSRHHRAFLDPATGGLLLADGARSRGYGVAHFEAARAAERGAQHEGLLAPGPALAGLAVEMLGTFTESGGRESLARLAALDSTGVVARIEALALGLPTDEAADLEATRPFVLRGARIAELIAAGIDPENATLTATIENTSFERTSTSALDAR